MFGDGCDDAHPLCPQKRVDIPFQRDARGQCGFVLGAQGLAMGCVMIAVDIVRFDQPREFEIGQRVFMRAINIRFQRERRQLGERSEHLLRRAFENAPASAGKQRIAAEQRPFAKIGDMSDRMARHFQYAETLRRQAGDGNDIAFGNRMIHLRDIFFCGPIDRSRMARKQRVDAADMVVMMVRDQNGRQLQAVFAQKPFHRRRFAGIDNDGLPGAVRNPDVVILKRGKRDNIHSHILHDLDRMSIDTFPQWLDTPPGRYLRDWECGAVDTVVADIFGFTALQVGMPEIDCLRANRMPTRFRCASRGEVDVLADATALPFECASVDLIVLPHMFEFSENPHQLLREVARILLPEGHVVITGFNPFSFWGLRRGLAGKDSALPWQGQYLSPRRLKDWLQLLGFETRLHGFGCYAPPTKSEPWLQRWRFMDRLGPRWWSGWGGAYLLEGIKRVQGMRLIQPEWRKKGASSKKSLPAVVQRKQTKEAE